MTLVSHMEYEEKWNRFCDEFLMIYNQEISDYRCSLKFKYKDRKRTANSGKI